MSAAKLLIVDSDAVHMQAMCDALGASGYVAHGVTAASQALEILSCEPFDLLVADLTMPEMDGIGLLTAAQRIDADIAHARQMADAGTCSRPAPVTRSGR